MPPDAALLILSVAAAFAFISAESTCRNTVHCSCGSTGKMFTVCAEQNTTSVDPCTRWPGCKSCKGGTEDPSCFTATNRTLRSRQKRQYGRGRSTSPARSARQAEEKKTCGDPGFLVNGFRRDSKGTELKSRRAYQEGESLVFGCRSNEYVLQGPSNLICRDGEWSDTMPKCVKRRAASVVAEKQTCGDPGFIVNGFRTDSNGAESKNRKSFQEGDSLVFGCRSNGYTLEGSSNMSCNNGKWSQPLPTCIQRTVVAEKPKQTCGDPGFLVNGIRRPSNGTELKRRRSFQEGESLVLSCRSKEHVLQGSSNIICRDGQWSAAMPKCINRTESAGSAYCKDPGRVLNGNRVPVGAPSQRGFAQGSSLEYSCNQGFTLQGVGSIACLASGRWSSAVPRCEESGDGESCLNPESIENGKVTYYPNSNSQRGSEVSMDDLEYPPNSRLVFSCNEGYRLQGASEMTCEGGSGLWSTDPPTCELGDGESCLNPESIENGKITYYPNMNSQRGSEVSLDDLEYPPNSRLVFSCNEGYRRQGPSEITCQGDGLWSTEPPTCELDWTIMYCENPGPFINGRVEYFPPDTFPRPISENDIEYPEGTRLQYTCAEGFDLQGYSNVSCLPTSHWSSTPPICSTECGLSFASTDSKVFNGTMSSAGEWPWVVSIREDSESEISCGGAVLNSRTVVTAAHCLPDTSKSYILYFGKIRKMDRFDDAKVMKRMSNLIKIFPYYSDQTMDSDIALIHFSNPIQFTDRVHPICLPDISSTLKNIRAGYKGFVAGFGENEFSLTPDNLMRANLPVQENQVCQKYFQELGIAMKMTHNMFCAGYPNAVQATCKGDSGSAFVFRNRTSNHYTLEGLVSASTNGQCGIYGKYTVFTKVLSYVPWLLQNLAL